MATFTIKTRSAGAVTFHVSSNERGGYVYCDLGDSSAHGTLGQQICTGGGTRGSTLMATPSTLERVARRWWRQRLVHLRDGGI